VLSSIRNEKGVVMSDSVLHSLTRISDRRRRGLKSRHQLSEVPRPPDSRDAGANARHCVYTSRVDDRTVVWDAANRRHIGADHPERAISEKEVDEVLANPDRVEVYLSRRQAYR